MQKIIILIGGMPTAGKTTLARKLAEQLSVPLMSTDVLREIMRTVAGRDEFPALFDPEGYTEDKLMKELSSEQLSDLTRKKAEVVWLGVKKLIEGVQHQQGTIIIEGTYILPHLVVADFGKDTQVKSVFLFDENKATVREVMLTRGLGIIGSPESDEAKDKEVEWVMHYSRWLRDEVNKYKLTQVEPSKNSKDDINSTLKTLGINSE